MQEFTSLVTAGISPEPGIAVAVAMRKLTILLKDLALEPRDLILYESNMGKYLVDEREMPYCVISCYVPVTQERVNLAVRARTEMFKRMNERNALPEGARPSLVKVSAPPAGPLRFNERTCVRGHAQRARRLGVENTFTYDQWLALRAWFGEKCLRCGTQHRLVADHIVSMRDGGANALHNIQPLCKTCNTQKSNGKEDYRDPAELAAFLAQLVAAPSP